LFVKYSGNKGCITIETLKKTVKKKIENRNIHQVKLQNQKLFFLYHYTIFFEWGEKPQIEFFKDDLKMSFERASETLIFYWILTVYENNSVLDAVDRRNDLLL
jgi:thioredoxin-related protein